MFQYNRLFLNIQLFNDFEVNGYVEFNIFKLFREAYECHFNDMFAFHWHITMISMIKSQHYDHFQTYGLKL